MLPGTCWYMNFDLPHRLSNLGTTDRVHLVFDIIINDAIRAMFAHVEPGMKKIIPAKDPFSAKDKETMIMMLKEMGTPAALELVRRMEEEIG